MSKYCYIIKRILKLYRGTPFNFRTYVFCAFPFRPDGVQGSTGLESLEARLRIPPEGATNRSDEAIYRMQSNRKCLLFCSSLKHLYRSKIIFPPLHHRKLGLPK